MSLIPEKEAEFLRLKMKMEIIRTICPMIMILIQLFIIIEIYWKICSTWNTLKTKNPQKTKIADFFIFRKNRKNLKKALTFRNFWRGGASSKSTIISTCSSKTCERFGELGHSLFLRPPHAPNSSSSTMVKNMQAPIVPQCEADVKSFLWLPPIKCRLVKSCSKCQNCADYTVLQRCCQVLFASCCKFGQIKSSLDKPGRVRYNLW